MSTQLACSHRVLGIVLVGYLALSLLACSSGPTATSARSTPGQTRQQQPTPTMLPAGAVLYQADWSHGLAGWQGSSGWHVQQGQLQTNLADNLTITVPYTPTVANYAIEVRLQVVNVPHDGGHFSIKADNVPGKSGYEAAVLELRGPGTHAFAIFPQAQVLIDPLSSMDMVSAQIRDFTPAALWHMYRIEVRGAQVALIVDGSRISRAVSTQTSLLSNGPIRLTSGLAILHISSFRILTV